MYLYGIEHNPTRLILIVSFTILLLLLYTLLYLPMWIAVNYMYLSLYKININLLYITSAFPPCHLCSDGAGTI